MNPLELVPAFLQNLGCSGRILVPLLKNHVSHVTAFQELPRASQCSRLEAFYVELQHVLSAGLAKRSSLMTDTSKRLSLLSEAAALVGQPFTPSDTLRAVIPVTHGRYETRFRGRSL